MDTNSVAHGEKKLTVNLAITKMDFYDFWKYLTSGDPLEEWKMRNTRLNNKRAKQKWVQAKLARVRGMVSPPDISAKGSKPHTSDLFFQFLGLAANNIIRLLNAPYRQVIIPAPKDVNGDLLLLPAPGPDVGIIEQANNALAEADSVIRVQEKMSKK